MPPLEFQIYPDWLFWLMSPPFNRGDSSAPWRIRPVRQIRRVYQCCRETTPWLTRPIWKRSGPLEIAGFVAR